MAILRLPITVGGIALLCIAQWAWIPKESTPLDDLSLDGELLKYWNDVRYSKTTDSLDARTRRIRTYDAYGKRNSSTQTYDDVSELELGLLSCSWGIVPIPEISDGPIDARAVEQWYPGFDSHLVTLAIEAAGYPRRISNKMEGDEVLGLLGERSLQQRRVWSFHEAIDIPRFTGYRVDGANKFSRGFLRWMLSDAPQPFVRGQVENPGSKVRVEKGDVVIYYALGDHVNISVDVEAANQAHLEAEVVFFLTTDKNYVPLECNSKLHFFQANTDEPMGGGLDCCDSVVVSGELEKTKQIDPSQLYYPLGNFSKIQGVTQNGRPIYKNDLDVFLFHFEDSYWRFGTDYTQPKAGFQSNDGRLCPKGAPHWEIYRRGYWYRASPNMKVDCADDISAVAGGQGCHVHHIPYSEGSSEPQDASLLGIHKNIFRNVQRRILASFVGTQYTWIGRDRLLDIENEPDVTIKMTDWWNVTGNIPSNISMPQHRQNLNSKAKELLNTSIFALCPRGAGPSSIRFVEAIASGAIPVLIDDKTMPYDDDLCDFAIRWTTRKPSRLDLLVRLLRRIAADPVQLITRRRAMWNFAKRHHPVWFDMRYVASKI